MSEASVVIASLEPLKTYKEPYGLTSHFFNPGHVVRLEALTETAVTTLLQLPATPGAGPALSTAHQKLARQWGQQHPYRLQLAAFCLYEAQVRGRSKQWAKAQFELQLRGGRKRSWWQLWR